jgi:hypothetical protein
MKKAAFVICSFMMIIFISSAFITKDGPKYKNLKILKKDISKEELDSVMHHFTNSLGQKCNFCHVKREQDKWDFASDSIGEKLIARKMMLMAMKINEQNFNTEKDKTNNIGTLQAVTCYTCHHGQARPENKPPRPVRDSLRNRPNPWVRDSMINRIPIPMKDSVPH